jgi:hypothetical protein
MAPLNMNSSRHDCFKRSILFARARTNAILLVDPSRVLCVADAGASCMGQSAAVDAGQSVSSVEVVR